jgi:hypothetical protein
MKRILQIAGVVIWNLCLEAVADGANAQRAKPQSPAALTACMLTLPAHFNNTP